MKRLVKDLVNQRGLKDLATVRPEASISDALKLLITKKCSAILVVRNGILNGIFSEKDFAKASLKKGFSLSDRVETVMTSKVFYAEPSFTLEECLQIMSKVHVRHLPVLEKDTPIAMLSMRHIMEALVEEKEIQIRELTNYITGPSAALELDQKIQKVRTIPVYSTQQTREVV